MTADEPLARLLGRVAIGYRPTAGDLDALPIDPLARAQVEDVIARTTRTAHALRWVGRYGDARRLCRGVSVDLQHLIAPRSDAR